jgi:serine-type D-Ala-D-Ala carboxypeptidase
VSIPEHARPGDGMQIPKLELVLREETGAAGIPSVAFAGTRDLLQSCVEAGLFTGAQILAGYKGAVALNWAAGKSAPAASAPLISAEDALDAGSISNIVVATAAMLAAESDDLMLEAPVQDYVPEYMGKDTARLRVRDLLSGLSDGGESSAVGSDALRDLLEEIVSRVSGLPFRQFLTRQLFEPLGMKRSSYAPPGHKALVTSARDLAVFAQMLLYRGIYDHRRYFKAKTVAGFTAGQGVWQKPSSADWTGRLFSKSAYGRCAPDGSSLWIDPAKQLFIIFLPSGTMTANGVGIFQAQEQINASLIHELGLD